jgi:hypothetical protein
MFHTFCGILAASLLASGCSAPTEAKRDNRRPVDAILTAISMKNTNWLDDDAKLAEQRHLDGHLTDAEYEQLSEIIEIARAGNWKAAEKEGYGFRKEHPYVKDGQ